MAPGAEVAKRQLLQLAIDLVQSQPVCDRRIDVQRFPGDALAFGRCHRLHRAHIVQTVGQLDQDDADIARHCQQHLAEILGLRFHFGGELQLVQFGQTVDQFCRWRLEARDQLGLGNAAVFHRVVHQRGHDGLGVKSPIGA